MQDDISTSSTGRTERTKKSSNGKWASKPASEMDNEAGSTLGSSGSLNTGSSLSSDSSLSTGDSKLSGVMGTARTAIDSVRTHGSDLLNKVDLSRGTGVIREYPIYAAVGGLVLGFVLGAALSRRSVY